MQPSDILTQLLINESNQAAHNGATALVPPITLLCRPLLRGNPSPDRHCPLHPGLRDRQRLIDLISRLRKMPAHASARCAASRVGPNRFRLNLVSFGITACRRKPAPRDSKQGSPRGSRRPIRHRKSRCLRKRAYGNSSTRHLEGRIESIHRLRRPLVFRSAPTDRDHRWFAHRVMNRCVDGIQKSPVRVGREVDRQPRLGATAPATSISSATSPSGPAGCPVGLLVAPSTLTAVVTTLFSRAASNKY